MRSFKNTIGFKLSFGLCIIFLLCGMGLNILIRIAFNENFQKSTANAMEEVMDTSRYQIKQNLILGSANIDEEGIRKNSSSILKILKSTHNMNIDFYDKKGVLIDTTETGENYAEFYKSEDLNKANVNIKYFKNTAIAKGEYPIYIENNYLANMVFYKDFSEGYEAYIKLINIITIIEFIVFFMIFIFCYIYTYKITRPISELNKVVNEVSDGNFNIENNIKTKDEIGELAKSFFLMKDRLKQQFNNLNEEKEKIKILEKSRMEFFYNVTHELKTPLTAISGYSQILMEDKKIEERFKRRASERIFIESEKLHSLVVDIINLSKGLAMIKQEPNEFSIDKIINNIIDGFEKILKDEEIKVDKHIEVQEVFLHEDKIKSLLQNLIGNGVKYSIKKGKIFIKAYKDEDNLSIDIANKAYKIDKNIKKKLREPFIRGNNSKDKEGHGLGLYICEEIVKFYNGEIYIDFKEEDKNIEWFKVNIKIPLSCNSFVIIN